MVDFPSLDPTTRRLPDVVRAQIATDLKDGAQVEGAAIAELMAGVSAKPAGGWASTDLATAVQTSLEKADTALQSAPVTSVVGKTGAVTLAASDVGAVPTTRTINGKPLSADVSLAAADVGAATPADLASRLNMRGDYVDGGTYAINDVVAVPVGSARCLQNHTSSGPAPSADNARWSILSNLVIGGASGQAADAAVMSAALDAKLGVGYAGAVAGSRFTVAYISGTGWPTVRPSDRTDIFFDWMDWTGQSSAGDTPAAIVTGDRVVRITAGTGSSAITVRSTSQVAPVGAVNYFGSPLHLPAPSGLAVGDYYLVAVAFGSLAAGADFVIPAGFVRLTPQGTTGGQDFGVFGYPIASSADVTAVASSAWSPSSTTVTRGVAVGVALQGVASVGTATAITYANPITSPLTSDPVTGDATFQITYTGNGSTSAHPVHASVSGTTLVQASAHTSATDPTPDTTLSICMNGSGVTFTPAATYGGSTNIPMTKV